ncbi:IS3 family transposase [Streptomyces sp. NBC_01717]|uniref:IS3 family transposase n=1 Tax=Streptomyces sp. NBC_01717 TaxID=2975918 RepID=UPI003FCD5453
MTVHPFIEAEKRTGHSVKRACELMKVSRTAFYARRSGLPGPRAVRDAELTEQILEAHAKSRGTYGAPRVHAVLKREGAGCGRRRVARLMRAAGLQGRHRRRRHVTGAVFRPDLSVRDFQPDRTGLDVRWCGDITHVPTDEGWLYLATVIDIASQRVVGWATADHLRTELVADALTAACRQRRPTHPVIFHSDRGCQYTSQLRFPGSRVRGSRCRRSDGQDCHGDALASRLQALIRSRPSGGSACCVPGRAVDRSTPGHSRGQS